jgi:toxin ParE1/3/4
LERIQPGLGDRFARHLKDLLGNIESMPRMYAVLWSDVRAARVKRFRYILYYVLFDDRAEVLAIIHGSRDESAWKSRR